MGLSYSPVGQKRCYKRAYQCLIVGGAWRSTFEGKVDSAWASLIGHQGMFGQVIGVITGIRRSRATEMSLGAGAARTEGDDKEASLRDADAAD